MKPFQLFLCLSILFLSSCNTKIEEAKKPNVLFILVDDYGYTDCSIMGSTYYETPNVDRIANEGMIFTDGYATCQVCSPSRASIMSGKFPARHGITDWIGAKTGEEWSKVNRARQLLPPEYEHTLAHEYTTLPEAMKEAAHLLSGIDYCDNAYEAVDGADAMVILTEWDQFRALDMERVKGSMSGDVVVDLRNIYSPDIMAKRGFAYTSIGRPA